MPLFFLLQLQCEFWNVGQGLFSSGRIQMETPQPFIGFMVCKFLIMVQSQF